MSSAKEWFTVRFDHEAIRLRARPPDGDAWEVRIEWEQITRVCFQAIAGWPASDEIYLFTNARPAGFVVPTEADGGDALWAEILARDLFDTGMAAEAANAPNEMFCSPLRRQGHGYEAFPLYSPRQLPEIEGDTFTLTWDQIGADSLVLYNDTLVWRETTGWEVYDRFEEIAAILQHKYGRRLHDLVPTPRSSYALLGDSTAAFFHVAHARESLGKEAVTEPYHWYPLAEAARNGDVATIKTFLAQGGDPNIRSIARGSADTLLHEAAWQRQVEIARMLVAARANVNAMDTLEQPPLVAALDTRRMPAASHYIRGFRIAPEALRFERTTELVKLLVYAGANLSGLNRPFREMRGPNRQMYRSPLTRAARYGYQDVLHFLLEQGADREAEDHFGDTPLIEALRWGQAESAQRLIAAGADVNRAPYSPNPVADTQLHLVIQSARFDPEPKRELIRYMIAAGADVNQPDGVGDSPLLTTVRYGTDHRYSWIGLTDAAGSFRWEVMPWPVWDQTLPLEQVAAIVRLLRDAGADVHARDRDGKTARELAAEAGFTEVAALL